MPRLYRGPHQRLASGQQWERLRDAVLADVPICRPCSAAGRVTLATQVDHILPLHKGGTNDPANLQPICVPCHTDKTVAERGQRRRPAFDLAGNPIGGTTHW